MISIVSAGVGLVTWDFTPLVGLISAIAGQVVIVLGYFVKSSKENSAGGITYQAMMNEFNAATMLWTGDKSFAQDVEQS